MFIKNLHSGLNIFTNALVQMKILVSMLLCLGALTLSLDVNAQGVEAGTNITNIAIVNYQISGIEQIPIESSPSGNSQVGLGNGLSTDFVVDRKIDLLVTGNTNTNVTPGDSQAEVTFTLQNQGNATQEFSLDVDSLITTDDFDISNCNIEVRSVSGTAVAGVTLPTSGNIKLYPDQQANIRVLCDIPTNNSGLPISSGNTSFLSLIAKAEKNNDGSITEASTVLNSVAGIETVFVDSAGDDDSVTDGKHSSRRAYIASSSTASPTLVMNKTIESVVDTSNGNSAITGSEVTYKILVSSSGIGTIENLLITDPTPLGMTYKPGSIKLNNVSQSDISDLDSTDFGVTSVDTATINIGNIPAGSQYEIILTYIIN